MKINGLKQILVEKSEKIDAKILENQTVFFGNASRTSGTAQSNKQSGQRMLPHTKVRVSAPKQYKYYSNEEVKMSKGENILKRKDGRWEARYIKGYELSGKIRYGFCYGRTYKEAKENVTKCRAAVLNGSPVP